MNSEWADIILAIIGLIAAASITISIVLKIRKSSTKTKQSKNVVFGDQAGRDIKK